MNFLSKIKMFGVGEYLKLRKRKLTYSISKRFGKDLIKFYPKLPQNYEFVVLNYGVSGHMAFGKFLSLCDLRVIHLADDKMMNYNEAKNSLEKSMSKNVVTLGYFQNVISQRADYARLFSKDAPILILLRDPISRIKAMVNHGWLKTRNSRSFFKFDDDINKALGEISYGGETNFPVVSTAQGIVKWLNFNYQSDLTPFLTNKGGGVSLAKLFTSIWKKLKQIKPLTR